TVTGETPTVDVQSVVRQRVMTSETMEELPVNRMAAFIASLIPGVNNTSVDVGGSLGPIVTGGGMTVHGSRSTDLLTMSNGLSLQSIQTGSAVQGVANMAQYQEVAIDTAAADASQSLGGVRMNLIPAEGGNQIHGSFISSFANSSMQGSNFDSDLKARGLPTPNGIKRNWDINPAVGGPLRQNKLWFFTTGRYTGAWNYAGILGNDNAGNPNAWTYAPNSERQATELNSRSMMGRVTWQAMQKQKFNFGYDYTGVCQCNQVSPTLTSEAAANTFYDPKHVVTIDWTSPITNRLLLDGSFLYLNLYRIADPAGSEPLIQVNEQSTGLTYRAKSFDNRNISIQWQYRGSLSYITGAHSFKAGFNNMTASSSMYTYLISPPLTYRFNNGVPNQFTEYALPSPAGSHTAAGLGLFAQDKWTHGRMTLSGGLRFDYFKTSFPEMRLGPTQYAPNPNIMRPETPGMHREDITARTGFAYDVFGNGRTAVKASLNKYVAGQALRGSGSTVAFGSALTPTNLLVTSAARSWVDSNTNFIVDCDLTNQAAQDRSATGGDVCGAGNALFGQNRAGTAYDPEILGGWGHRAYNWEPSVGVQQELLPRVSVDVSYFRRWFGNFAVTDNLAATPADFTAFTINAPTNSRLPNGGGYPGTGVNVVPAKFNVTDNYITFAKNYGKQTEHWSGVDVNFNVRPQAGTLLQGGLSTGRLTTDNCEVVAKLPETMFGQQTLQVTNAAANVVPAQFCHEQEPLLTQVKLLGTYLVPKIEVQISGTLQSIPGQQIAANYG